jgi:transcriptional regulator with XRE-family HTH domain
MTTTLMERPAAPATGAAEPVGALLRAWRTRRGRSQLDLALEVGVSPRHLSFIETGRSRPSAAMLQALAQTLELPLREHNRMLLAAGHAPRYAERSLSSAALAGVQAALQRLLDAHHPYPGFVLDRQWNVVQANAAGQRLAGLLPEALTRSGLNVFRVGLHPHGLAAHTANFAEWGRYLLQQLRALVRSSADPGLAALEAEVLAYPNVQALGELPAEAASAAPTLLVPCVLDLPGGRISMFSTLTTFGTPRDVTLDELCVELFYPLDRDSEQRLRALGGN